MNRFAISTERLSEAATCAFAAAYFTSFLVAVEAALSCLFY